ncbi:CYTH domain-containing protein [Virgibacillus xinjiangensis]|uniref:CYTH domain-containing protein n=1 Tax=Virgibacillus xinjiangensis TaxID=393090 RepID=A0ABV7CW42_9BACI
MTQEIEIEYKNLLTKEEFQRLLTSLPFPDSGKIQTNHYFETTEFSLKQHGSALRIREKGGEYQLTLKEPHPDGLLETHDRLTRNEVDAWLNGDFIFKPNVGQQLEEKGILHEDLEYYGSLTTSRREIEHRGVLLVLDYSTYNGREDYELELEADSKELGTARFDELLTEHNLKRRKTPNKIQRFFDSIAKA